MSVDSNQQTLLAIFAVEAQEHLHTINQFMLTLEKTGDLEEADSALAHMFRAAHTLKGAAGAAGIKEIQILSHQLEAIFGQLRSGVLKVEVKTFELVYQTIDTIDLMMGSQNVGPEVDELCQRLTALSRTSLPARQGSQRR
jgi:two-component system, chemotaxis family, sensor kinase CheA